MEQVTATVVRPGGRILLDGVRVFLRADEPARPDGWGGYFTVPVELPVEDGALYQLATDDGRAGRITVTRGDGPPGRAVGRVPRLRAVARNGLRRAGSETAPASAGAVVLGGRREPAREPRIGAAVLF
jgi:hypothetical protein